MLAAFPVTAVPHPVTAPTTPFSTSPTSWRSRAGACSRSGLRWKMKSRFVAGSAWESSSLAVDHTMQNSLRQRSTPRIAAALSLVQSYDGRISRATCVFHVPGTKWVAHYLKRRARRSSNAYRLNQVVHQRALGLQQHGRWKVWGRKRHKTRFESSESRETKRLVSTHGATWCNSLHVLF